MDLNKLNKLKIQWQAEESAFFQGWDFSHLKGRQKSGAIPWNYAEIVRKYLQPEHILLDMGTGGGEFLLTLQHPYKRTYVTESYPPNVELCMNKLAPLGIGIKQVFDDNNLPFSDSMFDIVINRHDYFNVNEVGRILKHNGIFITQQVGGENDKELRKVLSPEGLFQFANHSLKNNLVLIKNAGFEIIYQDECFPSGGFFDVGAVVYFAKAIEWEFPDFSVERCFEQLCELQKQIEENGIIPFSEHRFIIVARKI